MKRVEERELVLFYYGELPSARHRTVQALLDADASARARYRALRAALDAAEQSVPERDTDYGARVWARLNTRLDERAERTGVEHKRFGALVPRWLTGAVLTTVLAGVIGLAFFAGRYSAEHAPVTAEDRSGPDRVLAYSLAGHLEESQRLLTTYVNSSPDDLFDVYLERAWIEVLLTSNRLYRSAAEKTGQARVVAVLDEMERILVGLRHLPADMSPEDLAAEQALVRDQGTLFRLRILSRSLELEMRPRASSSSGFSMQQL